MRSGIRVLYPSCKNYISRGLVESPADGLGNGGWKEGEKGVRCVAMFVFFSPFPSSPRLNGNGKWAFEKKGRREEGNSDVDPGEKKRKRSGGEKEIKEG